uniref:Uncharacterized protein n=1 Tax=Oryza punctata TaxID=4537 RepID=A0A0E0JSX9_ORYPU
MEDRRRHEHSTATSKPREKKKKNQVALAIQAPGSAAAGPLANVLTRRLHCTHQIRYPPCVKTGAVGAQGDHYC